MFVIKVIDGKDVRCVGYSSKELACAAFRRRIALYNYENDNYNLTNDVSILFYGDTDCTKLIDTCRIYHKEKESLELNREDLIECEWGIKYFIQAMQEYGIKDATTHDLEKTLKKLERILDDGEI